MFKHILVILDGTPASEQALKQAVMLAKQTQASLTGLSVIEKLPAFAASLGEVEDVKNEAEAFFTRIHAEAGAAAQAAGVVFKSAIRAGKVDQVVVRFSEEHPIDLIVLGPEGSQGLSEAADKICDLAPCSVLVARSAIGTLTVGDVMTADVAWVTKDTPLDQVVALLLQRQVKAVPVVEDRRVVGIITGGDLLERGGMGLRLSLQRQLTHPELIEQQEQLSRQGKLARDIMTSPVVTIGRREKITRAARLMAEKNIKRLPVVDQNGMLTGIISRLDIIAMLASASQVEELPIVAHVGETKTARDILFRDVPTTRPDTPLNEVINRVVSSPLRRVVVVDDLRRVLGIISDADLLGLAYQQKRPGLLEKMIARLSNRPVELLTLQGKAADIMEEIITIQAETPLAEIGQLMVEKRIKRLAVVDEAQHLLGMVDRESLLRVLASLPPQ